MMSSRYLFEVILVQNVYVPINLAHRILAILALIT
jgi:hypothetical protein